MECAVATRQAEAASGRATTGAADADASKAKPKREIAEDEKIILKLPMDVAEPDAKLHQQYFRVAVSGMPSGAAVQKTQVQVSGDDGDAISLKTSDKTVYFRKVYSDAAFILFKNDTMASIADLFMAWKRKWCRGLVKSDAILSCVHYARSARAWERVFESAETSWAEVMADGLDDEKRVEMNDEHWQVLNVVITHFNFTAQLPDTPGWEQHPLKCMLPFLRRERSRVRSSPARRARVAHRAARMNCSPIA